MKLLLFLVLFLLSSFSFAQSKEYQLFQAISGRELQTVKKLIASGVDINTQLKESKETPLMYAIGGSRYEIFLEILKAKPNLNLVNSRGQSALHYTISVNDKERLECAKHLIQANIDVNIRDKSGYTVLMAAIEYGRKTSEDIAFLLLDRPGLDVESTNFKKETALRLAIKNWYGNGPLIVEKLIRRGANVNSVDSEGRTILIAAMVGDTAVAIIESLIRGGAKLDAFDGKGLTALMYAASAGSPTDVSLLVNAGAKLNLKSKSKDYTALMYAIHNHSGKVVQVLVNVPGIDLELGDKTSGMRPLHLAVLAGNLDSVVALVEAGANTQARINGTGLTPMGLAKSRHNSSSTIISYFNSIGIKN